MDPTRNCDQCGKPLRADAQFCSHCGSYSGSSASTSGTGATTRQGPWERILDRLRAVTAGRYEVERLLGWGGMAGVYLAEELRLKRRVAIKVISPGLLMDPSQIERFEQEARTTAQLNHPNIVTIFEVDEREDLHYFSMTYVPGRSLSQVMGESAVPVPVPVVESWVRQVAGALSYAHHRGVVHRDIKPGNILLDEHGNALVGDFGIAKVAEEPGLTRTGMLVGTPAYMSPEQCTTGQVTGASDQYSLGAVAYQLLAGAPPFSGSTIQVIQAHVNETPRPVRELRPDCPALLADVVMRMLAKKPEDRWPSLYDAVDAIGGATLRHDDPVRHTMAQLSAWTHGVRIEGAPADGPLVLEEGDELELRAATLDHMGRELPGRRVRWSSEPAGVVEVSGDGMVRAAGRGRARIVASSGRVRAECGVEVGAPTPAPAGRDEAILPPPPPVEDSAPTPGPPPPPPSAPAEPTPTPAFPPPVGGPPVSASEEAPTPVPGGSPPPAPAAEGAEEAEEWETRVVSSDEVKVHGDIGTEAAPVEAAVEEPAPVAPDEPSTPAGLDARKIMAGVAVVALVVVVAVVGIPGGGSPPEQETGPPSATPTEPDAAPPSADPGPVVATAEPAVDTAGEAPEAGPDDSVETPAEPPAAVPAEAEAPPRAPANEPPAAPAPGTVRILGDLPPGALVRVRGSGVDRATGERSLRLAPGAYTLEVRAEGYEMAATRLTVASGASQDWRPTLTPVAPPPVEEAPPPVVDERSEEEAEAAASAARAAAVTAAVEAFGAALESRDAARLRQAWPSIPAAALSTWDNLMSAPSVRELRATVAVGPIPPGGDDRVEVPLTLRLRFYNPQQGQQDTTNPYVATVERSGAGWVLAGLRPGN